MRNMRPPMQRALRTTNTKQPPHIMPLPTVPCSSECQDKWLALMPELMDKPSTSPQMEFLVIYWLNLVIQNKKLLKVVIKKVFQYLSRLNGTIMRPCRRRVPRAGLPATTRPLMRQTWWEALVLLGWHVQCSPTCPSGVNCQASPVQTNLTRSPVSTRHLTGGATLPAPLFRCFIVRCAKLVVPVLR